MTVTLRIIWHRILIAIWHNRELFTKALRIIPGMVGSIDAGSDCDFIVAIRHHLTSGEIRELDRLHEAIHRLPYLPWRHRLEGSYAPLDALRRWIPDPREPPWGSSAKTGLAR